MRRLAILALLVLVPPRMGLLDRIFDIEREGDDDECVYCGEPRRVHIRDGRQVICPDELDP